MLGGAFVLVGQEGALIDELGPTVKVGVGKWLVECALLPRRAPTAATAAISARIRAISKRLVVVRPQHCRRRCRFVTLLGRLRGSKLRNSSPLIGNRAGNRSVE